MTLRHFAISYMNSWKLSATFFSDSQTEKKNRTQGDSEEKGYAQSFQTVAQGTKKRTILTRASK